MNPKIFITAFPVDGGDVVGFALAEDGTGLAQHMCSNSMYVRYDLGLTSTRQHGKYAMHYPEGYELVDLIDATDEELEGNIHFMEAQRINAAREEVALDSDTEGKEDLSEAQEGKEKDYQGDSQ